MDLPQLHHRNERRTAMSEVTDEQRAAVEWLHATLKNRMLRDFAETLLAALPDTLTNPQPAEPGLYVLEGDMSGSVWRVEVDGTIGQVGGNPFNKSPRGPYTRLVPERPEPSWGEIQQAWDVSRDTDESIPREFDGRMLAANAYFAGYKAGAKR